MYVRAIVAGRAPICAGVSNAGRKGLIHGGAIGQRLDSLKESCAEAESWESYKYANLSVNFQNAKSIAVNDPLDHLVRDSRIAPFCELIQSS